MPSCPCRFEPQHASVASFFVSRVDTEVDKRLEALAGANSDNAAKIRSFEGKAAVAQAQEAYRIFKSRFTGGRWEIAAYHNVWQSAGR